VISWFQAFAFECNLYRCNEGNPLLWLATKRGHQEVVEILLEAGAAPNGAAPNGFTPLHRSASEGFQGITEALLRGERCRSNSVKYRLTYCSTV
jgi:ankyrin repeat protein